MNAKIEQFPAKNPNPVLTFTKDGIVLYSNEAGELLLYEWGVKVGGKLPSNIEDIAHRVISQHNPEKMEIKVGNRIYLVVFSPLPEQECVNISGFDISDQKEAEEEIQESEERLKALMNNNPSLVFLKDEYGRYVYLNNAYEKQFVLSKDWYRKTDFDFWPKESAELFRANDSLVLKTGQTHQFMEDSTDLNGKRYCWLDYKFPFIDSNNKKYVGGIAIDATDRVRADEALRSERNFLNAVLDTTNALVCILDREGRIVRFNKACEKKTGYTSSEVMGRVFWDFLLTEEEKPAVIEGFKRVEAGQFPFDYENHWVARNSEPALISWSNTAVLDQDGEVEYIIATGMDITERKNAEDELKKAHETLEEKVKERTAELEKAYALLKEREESLAEAQAMADIGNWVWDIKTDKAYWSDELYRIFGRSAQESAPTYNEYLNYVHPDDLRYVADAFKKAVIDGKSYSIDHRIILANGEERTINIKSEIIFDKKNAPVRVKGTVQDITERKRVEEKLRESEEKYRNIVETANEGILIINDDNIITYVNKKMSDMLGYTVEEGIGRPIWGFISEECKPDVKLHLEKRMRGISESYELKLICKDGSSVWTFLNVKPLFDKEARYIGAMSMFTDITKRKEAEEALANIQIARQKEIHHRIKNNLQVISSLLDLQAEKFKGKKNIEDSQVLEAFRESQDRVISMALIHEELHKGGEINTLNFSHYIAELADNLLLTYRLGNDCISLNMDIEEDIFFDMDTAVPLGIIINELVSNSLKHAFSGRDSGEIKIKLHREENEECEIRDCKSTFFTLTVSDNGIGIPENLEIEDIYCLGLQLLNTLVDQLDGELELKRDNGTEFKIKFLLQK